MSTETRDDVEGLVEYERLKLALTEATLEANDETTLVATAQAMYEEAERALDEYVTTLRERVERYEVLRRAVNEHSGDCSPDCDGHGHAEDCEYVDMAHSLESQQVKIESLRERVERLRRERNSRQEDALLSRGQIIALKERIADLDAQDTMGRRIEDIIALTERARAAEARADTLQREVEALRAALRDFIDLGPSDDWLNKEAREHEARVIANAARLIEGGE